MISFLGLFICMIVHHLWLFSRILLRVRLLYIMRCEVIGPMETAVRNDCQARYERQIDNWVLLSERALSLSVCLSVCLSVYIYIYIYIYIWSEVFGSPSEGKHGGQWSPKLRQSQSPYAVFCVYVLRTKPRRGTETDVTSELYKDWNDTCKPNFEAFVEADMQVIPSPP